MKNSELSKIVECFNVEGLVKRITPFGNGLINKTFLVTTTEDKYMLQAINTYAFHNVDDLMRNIYIVTNSLSEKGVETLKVIKTKNNRIYVEKDGFFYRMYDYVGGTVCYDEISDLTVVRRAARAFGKLHLHLSDLDPILIAETIPHFHDTPKRYENLLDAVNKDEYKRVSVVKNDLQYFKDHQDILSKIVDGLADGTIPERIVHNDPKINNVLFDHETNKARCVIDLDTVMPGSALYDFGDALRSLFTGDNESALDSNLLKVNLDIYSSYCEGYLHHMKSSLTKEEIILLPWSIFILACELSMRFMEDYLRGDKYFKTSFQDENLVRARNQLSLAKDVEKNMDKMIEITKKYLGE